jgi:hypothetical protein
MRAASITVNPPENPDICSGFRDDGWRSLPGPAPARLAQRQKSLCASDFPELGVPRHWLADLDDDQSFGRAGGAVRVRQDGNHTCAGLWRVPRLPQKEEAP